MKRHFYILLFPLVAAVTSFLQCSGTDVAGGGTIETTNGVTGAIRNSDGTPAPATVVRLFPDEYDPVADSSDGGGFIDTTDIHGSYRFSRVAAGQYVVLARNRIAATSFLARGVTANDDSLTIAPVGTLGRSGSISADFSPGGVAAGGYVYIPGTDIASPIGSDGSALLAEVPPGIISTIILASGENEKRNLLGNEIAVTAGDTVIIDQPLWKYRCRLAFNTTPAGADVAGDVYNFPVLIRLDAGNFDFAQTRSDGGDLMFTGNGNGPLPNEIERWDPATELAEVWVKVDTVYGNDSSQSITMFWGNPDAVPQSANGGVFDTTDGYQGVWHLGGDADDRARDATVNHFDGTAPDTARPRIAGGIIGNCRVFDGVADFITMPTTARGKLNFPEKGYYTVSTWVAIDTLDGAPHLIVAKGYEQYFMRFTYFPSNTPLLEFAEFSATDKWQACTTTATPKEWILLTGVMQGNSQLLYRNGIPVDSTPNIYPADKLFRDTSSDLSIGRFLNKINLPNNDSGYCFFKGSIDEVRIISAARSPDWVRLCYMNQRAGDRLVVFK